MSLTSSTIPGSWPYTMMPTISIISILIIHEITHFLVKKLVVIVILLLSITHKENLGMILRPIASTIPLINGTVLRSTSIRSTLLCPRVLLPISPSLIFFRLLIGCSIQLSFLMDTIKHDRIILLITTNWFVIKHRCINNAKKISRVIKILDVLTRPLNTEVVDITVSIPKVTHVDQGMMNELLS